MGSPRHCRRRDLNLCKLWLCVCVGGGGETYRICCGSDYFGVHILEFVVTSLRISSRTITDSIYSFLYDTQRAVLCRYKQRCDTWPGFNASHTIASHHRGPIGRRRKRGGEDRLLRGEERVGEHCDRTAQNSSVLSPKPVHVAIKR
jgi:hypothetical protein